jgi:DNA-binding MarR family transcriptional regulator
MSQASNSAQLQATFMELVRALGLVRPDTTPCGQPMSTSEAHAISELRDRGPMTQTELATRLRLVKSTVSRLVDQLELRHLARRIPNPADRRSVHVALTTGGERRADRLAAARRDLFDRLLAELTPHDRRRVIGGLARLEEAARRVLV